MDIEVTDDGRFSAPPAGLLHRAPEQIRGRGVWLAHQLCDSVHLWTDPTTTVRLHFAIEPAASSGAGGTTTWA